MRRDPVRRQLTALLFVLAFLPLSACEEDSPSSPGADAPDCEVAPASLDFGDVAVGQTAARTFSLTNNGTGTLTGTVNASLCAEYSVQGDASYSLDAGEARTFTIVYAPTAEGTDTCDLQTGTDCGTLPATGNGIQAPALVRWPLDGDGSNEGSGPWIASLQGDAEFAACAFDGSGSLWLDGASGSVAFEADPAADFEAGDAFTLMAWIKPTGPIKPGINTIFANARDRIERDGFKFFVNDFATSDGRLILETGNGTEGAALKSEPGLVVPGFWQHVAVTVDRIAGTATLYHMGFEAPVTGAVRTDFRTTANAFLGAFEGGFFPFRGYLDDFRFYTGILSPAEILAIVDAPRTGTDEECRVPVIQFSFDDTEDDANGGIWNVGPVQGAVLDACAYAGSGGLILDGVNDYADLEIDGNVNQFPAGNRFTFATWIRPGDPFDFGINTIVANAEDENFRNGFKFFFNTFNSTDGALVFETGNGAEGDALVTNAGVVQPGVWQHVAVTVDRLAGTATLYHNGVAQTATGGVRTDFKTTRNLYIGSFAGNVFNYRGSMDDFRYYDDVLTAAQIARMAGTPFSGTSAACN